MSKQEQEREMNSEPQTGSAQESVKLGRRRRHRQRQLEASVNMDELRELITLIQENGFAEFEFQRESFRLYVRRDIEVPSTAEAVPGSTALRPVETVATETAKAGGTAAKATVSPDHPGARAETAASEDQDLFMIPSPIVGTFYRSPSPNSDPFVKIGSHVEPDSVVCIIEAMKLMNEIQAETSGEVVKIYVENGQPVEYGQPLFGLRK
ncbi:MAG: acetyl-CoA carboxylase biotin carboxyl carrier protein [Pyrinomonadaceae bacterium]